MKRATLSPIAEADLDEIADYIAEDNPERAETFIREIVEHCNRIAERPRIGRARPDIGADIRSVPHRRYVIFYRIIDACVEIVHVLHSARDTKKQF